MSVEGGVRPNRTFGRKMKDLSDDIENLYGLVNSIDNKSGVPSGADIGTGSTGVTSGRSDSMPITGGVFEGPYGSLSQSISIIGGNLKLNESAAGDPFEVRRIIFVDTETGVADDLDTIEGRIHQGQEHVLVGVVGNTVTIKHNNTAAESNDERAILCPGDVDFTLEGDNAIGILFDVVANKWKIIGNAGTGTGGGGGTGNGTFISASLSANQLQSVSTGLAVGKHIEFDVIGQDGGIVLQNPDAQPSQNNGIFELIGGRTYSLTAVISGQFNSSATLTHYHWYDLTNSVQIGTTAELRPHTSPVAHANQPVASVVLTPATNIEVELRISENIGFIIVESDDTWATIHEIGGGGGVTFPIEPTVTDAGDTWTGTQTLDLGVGDGHVFKWTVDQDLTFATAVSNIPAALTQRTFELEFVHDGVGGTFTVTLPNNFVDENGNNLASFDISANTVLLSCRINDGTTFLVLTKNVVAQTVLGEVFTWTADHSAAGFDLNSLGNLDFFQADQSITSASGSLTHNDAALGSHRFSAGGTEIARFVESAASVYRLDMLAHEIHNSREISFDDATEAVIANTQPAIGYSPTTQAAMRYNVPTAKSHIFAINNTDTMTLSTNNLTFSDGLQVIFNPDATNAGVNVGLAVGDPSATNNGDVWYNSTTNKLRTKENGVNVDAVAAAGANTSLSNLTTTSINQALLPSGLNTLDLGSELLAWRIIHARELELIGDASVPSAATDNQISKNASGNIALNNAQAGGGFLFYFEGVNNWSISPTTITGPNAILSETLTINDNSANPGANGQFTRNGNVVGLQADEYSVRHVTTTGTDMSELSLIKVDTSPTTGDLLAAVNFGVEDTGVLTNYAAIQVLAQDQPDAGELRLQVRANNNNSVFVNALTVRGDDNNLAAFASLNARLETDVVFGVETGATDLKIYPAVNALGLVVQDNVSFNVGSDGTVAIPVVGGLASAAAADAAAGDHKGAMVILDPGSTSVTLYVRQINGNWASVAMTRDALT